MIHTVSTPMSRRLGAGFALATVVLLGACARIETPPVPAKPLHIDLTAPVAEQVDLAWPHANGVPAVAHTIAQPRKVSLRLPSGRQIVMPADRVRFEQRGGTLVGVHIQPGGGAAGHPDTLAQTRAVLQSNRLLDPALARTLDGWRSDAVAKTTRVTIRDVDVEIALTPGAGSGWQASLDFEPRTCDVPAGDEADPDACLQARPTSTVVAGG